MKMTSILSSSYISALFLMIELTVSIDICFGFLKESLSTIILFKGSLLSILKFTYCFSSFKRSIRIDSLLKFLTSSDESMGAKNYMRNFPSLVTCISFTWAFDTENPLNLLVMVALGSFYTVTLNLYLFGVEYPSSSMTSILYVPLCLISIGYNTNYFPCNLINDGSGLPPTPTFSLIKLAVIFIGRNSASSASGSKYVSSLPMYTV